MIKEIIKDVFAWIGLFLLIFWEVIVVGFILFMAWYFTK